MSSKKDYRRRPEHQALFNSREWQEIKRYTFHRTGGLCERCIEEGKEHGRKIGDEKLANEGWIWPGVDCHHIIPWETGRTMDEVKRLFFDRNNIRLLCIPCHIKTHQEMRSHTKEKVKENKARARQRFMEVNDPKFASEREQDDAFISHAEREQSRTECNYGAKADAYLKNLEEQAKMEDIIYPDEDPNKTPI